jgi:triacylglycerol esterase/lipase EstA (alpha/beta hydrolase family)/CHAT domain-containing protein/tetratricopeptide (TPR) repeat protein
MATVSDEQRTDWLGIGISGRGLRAEVEWGVAGASRSATGPVDQVSALLSSTEGLQVEAEATVGQLEVRGTGGRGGAAEGALVVDLGRPDPSVRRVVLVEEEGQFAWFIPEDGEQVVELSVEDVPGSRGRLTSALRRVVRVVAVKTVGRVVTHVTRTLVGAWDEHKHPYRLRSWTPDDHRSADAGPPDLKLMASGPALLVIHGFTGSIHGSFATMETDLVRDVHRAYGRRTFAFDHPTLAVPPDENARWLLDQLPKGARLEVDIMAHSRGGLVARELAQRIKDPRLHVRSIVFVATPNAGTPLGDTERPQGLLNSLTNLVGAIPGAAPIEMALELVQDIVLRSSLAGLSGLIAMNPSGPYLAGLNKLAAKPGELTVRAITADFEPRTDSGIALTARDKLIDLYFGGVRNDLIVPTISTYVTGGAFRIPSTQRLMLDSSRAVNHSTFWNNDRFEAQAREWLRPDTAERPPPDVSPEESDPRAEVALPPDPKRLGDLVESLKKLPKAARKAVEEFAGGPISDDATAPTGDRRAVVVVPGIMGSHLRVKSTGNLIWIDPMRLARGQFARLELGAGQEEVEAAGLNRTYLPLIARLAATSDVYLADFDWRVDIRDSARRLAKLIREQVIEGAPKRTVHLVAHSMGGLVCRALALDEVDHDLWQDLGDPRRASGEERSGRLLMLATPNAGSYSIPLTLTGAEMILKALAAIDLHASAGALADVVATFPGVYQMLPSEFAQPEDDDHKRLYTAATWGQGSPVTQPLLDQAKDFHQGLHEVRDPDRLIFVAGFGHPTPFRLEVKGPGAFSIGHITNGDGRVAIKLGLLDGVTTFYSTATHGGIPGDPDVLAAVDELLTTGTSATLRTEEPARRGVDALERPPMVPAEEWDPLPAVARSRGDAIATTTWRDADAVLQDALSLTLGGGAVPTARPRLRVSVVHAGIEHASYPIVVGHYTGLPPGGAEAALDSRLDKALRQRQRLGMYPEEAGTAIYVPAPKGHRPVGGMVLGLGDFGGVTEAILTQAMNRAVLDLLLDTSARRTPEDPLPKGVSSVLVGVPGRYGLPLQSSIRALATGVARALVSAREGEPPLPIEDFELELIEYYENRAENAAQVVLGLGELLERGLREEIELEPADRLARRGGARPGAPMAGESGEPWIRVEIGLKVGQPITGPIRTIDFTMLTRGAQANIIEHELDLPKLRDFVDEAVRRAGAGEEVSRTLYELLFPLRSKLDLDPSESLHLLVDEEMAQLPWELLAARDQRGEVTELALRAGMLRQLRSADQTRERSERPVSLRALLVGDPPTNLPRLPGARDEARRVRELLAGRGWDVTDRIYDADAAVTGQHWLEIDNALHDQPYRVVHVAAHGIYDEDDPDHRRSGVVIGPEDHHRLTALDFRQMSVTPDLVFLNCCHLGRLGSFLESQPDRRDLRQPHRVAGTVARQLLRNGVGAVIVAGWAVDDVAGLAFATTLYRWLLDGHSLGDAVRQARLDARDADGGRTTTWGAYQCYGDPGFTLVAEQPWVATETRVVSSAQLARGFEVLAAKAGDSSNAADIEWVAGELERLRADGADLSDDAQVLSALGRAYAELGDFEQAIGAYEQALAHPKGTAPISTAEQLANLRVRLALALDRGEGHSAEQARRIEGLLAAADSLLDKSVALAGPTAERHALRGSFHKKRATIDDAAARAEDLVAARDAYERAWELSSKDRDTQNAYHTNLWLQMAALTKRRRSLNKDEAEHLRRLLDQVERRTDTPQDYWDLAEHADTLVTCAVAGATGDKPQAEVLADARKGYQAAFKRRSTLRERESSMDHLDDLTRLVDGPLKDDLLALLTHLRAESD